MLGQNKIPKAFWGGTRKLLDIPKPILECKTRDMHERLNPGKYHVGQNR